MDEVDEQDCGKGMKRVQMRDGPDWESKWPAETSRSILHDLRLRLIMSLRLVSMASVTGGCLTRIEHEECNLWPNMNVESNFEHEMCECPTFSQTQTNHRNWLNKLKQDIAFCHLTCFPYELTVIIRWPNKPVNLTLSPSPAPTFGTQTYLTWV